MDEKELLKRLLEAFKLEADEHTNTIVKGLIELEKQPEESREKEILEQIYRSAHSMKGAARAVNHSDIEKLCQAMEGCFSLMKKNELKLAPASYDLIHSVVNAIELLMNENEENPEKSTIKKYIETLNNISEYQDKPAEEEQSTGEDPHQKQMPDKEEKETAEPKETINETKVKPVKNTSEHEKETIAETPPKEEKKSEESQVRAASDVVRLSSRKIDEIYLLAEESLQLKLSHAQERKELTALKEAVSVLKKQWEEMFSNYNRLIADNILHQSDDDGIAISQKQKSIESFDTAKEQWRTVDKLINQLNQSAQFLASSMSLILDNLADEIKNIMMLPFSNVLDAFPRMVRELTRDMGKEADIHISGDQIEVDRRIMEAMKDPLIHIIRNSLDHGIEKPEVREKKGKPRRGKIVISVTQIDGKHVQLEIADDGAGIPTNKVLEKAISNGIITSAEADKLSDEEIKSLIFKSGMSSSSLITDISGRGLGLAIVEENVEKLGGVVKLSADEKAGTTFFIKIPTSVSKSQGLVIKLNDKLYILPVAGVVETLRIDKNSVKRIENKLTIQHQQKVLHLVRLSDVLELPAQDKIEQDKYYVVILESLNQRIGFIVDSFEDEQEVLFKKPGHPLVKVRNVSGVSLLGNGEVCPVLNNQDLVKSALISSISATPTQGKTKKAKKQKSIVMAEDSITSRLFLKSILEGAGYKVKVTIDGKEALTALKQEKYDMLVSDIEMPRMNGFELTEAVRSDNQLADLPIVLVTSLSKREDREKGIDVGANAYIVKSSFEKSNLLEVVERLI